MVSRSGRYVLSFNGEIYNHQELRAILSRSRAGHWVGSSDTESLLEFIDERGLLNTLDLVRGMFGFALLDRSSRTVHLVRDRFGEKPLYFARTPHGVAFASEPQALFLAGADDGLSPSALLSLVASEGLSESPFRSVSRVAPGTVVTISDCLRVSSRHYWDLSSRYRDLAGSRVGVSIQESREEFSVLLAASVKEQLEADVPLGAFLSGGVDSSLVVAVTSRLLSKPVETFTVGFPETSSDESAFASDVAATLGTHHFQMPVKDVDVPNLVQEAIRCAREPFVDPSIVPTLALARLARERVTVVLTGDGADELFFGYSGWGKDARRSLRVGESGADSAVPKLSASRALVQRLRRAKVRASSSRGYDIRRVLAQDLLFQARESADSGFPRAGSTPTAFDAVMEDGMKSLGSGILQKVDRASMAVSLEARAPFLSTPVAEFAMSIPFEHKFHGGMGKFIVREELKRYLPTSVVDRPKQGFLPPLDAWFRGPLRELLYDTLSMTALRDSNIFRRREVQVALQKFESGELKAGRIWPVFAIEFWLQSARRQACTGELGVGQRSEVPIRLKRP